MKTLKYIFIIVMIIIMIYSSISCSKNKSNNQKSITLQSLCKTFPTELLSESNRIMAKRLACLNINNFTIDEDVYNSQLIVKVNDNADIQLLSEVLTSRGNVNFLGTFNREDVLMNLHKGLSSTCIQRLDSLLGITESKKYTDAIIGQADTKDTFAISKFFRSKTVKSLLPSGIKFCWSKSVNSSNRFELYAVSTENTTINETSLIEVSITKDDKHIVVSISFKPKFWGALKNLTKSNLDKAIALVVDGRVYSAPIVRSVISGGKIEITGNFSKEEANMLVAIISNGELPLDFQVK